MSEEQVEYPNDIIKRKFFSFRLELGVRSTNGHVGSGLGGNPAEFWFSLNNTFKLYVGEQIKFEATGDNEITVWLPGDKDLKVKDIRLAFSKFVKDHCSLIEMDDNKIKNLSFLKDIETKHPNAKAYIKGVEKAHELAFWLDSKIEFKKTYEALFEKEIKFLEAQYLKDIGLPEDYFELLRKKEEQARVDRSIDYNDQNRNEDPNRIMFQEHPIWGAKRKAILEREKIFEDNLLSQEDKDRMQFLGSLPGFICIQIVRSIIGIERIVSLNLDESWDTLGKINKQVQ